MRKSRIQKLAIALIAASAVLGSIGDTSAQMHDGSPAGGGGFHGGAGSHGGGMHGGDGMHHGDGNNHGNGNNHGDGSHHGGGFHGRPTIIFGPGYYPYGYSYPYDASPYSYYSPYAGDSSEYQWYCPDPAGYYPDVQACPSGWLQVVPNG